MKTIHLLLILLLFSCGTRTAVKSTETSKENTKVEQTTTAETTAKIERKEVETETKEVGKINFAITPNPTFQKLSKDCPQNIIYKDKTGTEVSIPYENQLINLDSQNSIESKLKASEEYIESLTKENNNLKSEISEYKKVKNSDVKSERTSLGWFALVYVLGIITIPAIRMITKNTI
jgi:hypothetical protein